ILASGEVDGLVIHGVIGSLFMDELGSMMGGRMPVDNDPFMEIIDAVTVKSLKVMKRRGLPVVISAFWDRSEDSSVRAFQDGGVPCHMTPESAVQSLRTLYERALIEKRGG
ncbi:MAG: hypothetical protein WC889_19220, partial [Myxococcota bacterium]